MHSNLSSSALRHRVPQGNLRTNSVHTPTVACPVIVVDGVQNVKEGRFASFSVLRVHEATLFSRVIHERSEETLVVKRIRETRTGVALCSPSSGAHLQLCFLASRHACWHCVSVTSSRVTTRAPMRVWLRTLSKQPSIAASRTAGSASKRRIIRSPELPVKAITDYISSAEKRRN